MCGIAGILRFDSSPVDRESLEILGSALDHRGPDDAGTYVDGNVGLVHRRLSILDLSSAAHQPMVSEDRAHVLCYNGEVYNFAELRQELVNAGVKFRSTGDTEVLLEACRRWGPQEAARRANGMFAFAYWDKSRREMWIARDRLGIKPVYYTEHKAAFYFASEIKAILQVVSCRPDKASLLCLLNGTQIYEPLTPFDGVRALEPGCLVQLYADGTRHFHRYYSLEDDVDCGLYREMDSMPEGKVVGLFDELLQNSVKMHLASDASVAATISGGVDSSVIAHLTHQHHEEISGYHANVVGSLSEFTWAQRLADHSGMALKTADVAPEMFVEYLAKTTFVNECPLTVHPNTVPFYVMCKLAASNGVKVLLTGEGADELFGGYPAFQGYARQRRIDTWTAFVCRGLSALGMSRLGRALLRLTKNANDSGLRSLHSSLLTMGKSTNAWTTGRSAYSFIPDSHQRDSQVDLFCYLQSYLQAILWRNDRMGMAVGLESRVPFLENNLIRHAVNLPLRYKMRGNKNKWILRAVAQRYLPGDLANRPKYGFPVETAVLIAIGPKFFEHGFLNAEMDVTSRELDALKMQHSDLYYRCVLAEVWGKMFFQDVSVEECTAMLQEHCSTAKLCRTVAV